MENLYDLIIIGGGPAGMSAAIYAGRAMLKTLVLDSGGGGQISITEEIVNYPGIVNISGSEYMANLRKQVENFNVEYKKEEVISVDISADIKVVETQKQNYKAVAVIIATGAKPRKAGFIGEDEFKGRGVGYCATCDGQFFEGMDIFVIGGGLAAAEEALFLTRYGRKIFLLVRKDKLSCPQSVIDKIMANEKIEIKYNTVMESISGSPYPDKAVILNTATGVEEEYRSEEGETFGTFVFAGYEPVTNLVKDRVKLSADNYIETDGSMQTDVVGVFSAGDVRPKKLRQLVTAVSDGAIAATNAEKYIQSKKEELNLVIEREAIENNESLEQSEFFDSNLVEQLEPVFEKFENPIELVMMYDNNSPNWEEMQSFLTQLGKLSDKVNVKLLHSGEDEYYDKLLGNELLPFIAVFSKNSVFTGIKYHAIPGGHEFNSFILAMYNAAGPGQQVEDNYIEQISSIKEGSNVKVGISLSCTMCPDVVMNMQNITRYCKNTSLQIIDIFTHNNFKNKYNIMSVPAIIVNDSDIHFGKKTMDELLSMLTK